MSDWIALQMTCARCNGSGLHVGPWKPPLQIVGGDGCLPAPCVYCLGKGSIVVTEQMRRK